MVNMKWKRYRFKTRFRDCRPLIFNEKFPWWISGSGVDYKGEFTVIVAYLHFNEDLHEYWNDAEDIDFTEEKEIVFTARFPEPSYFKKS